MGKPTGGGIPGAEGEGGLSANKTSIPKKKKKRKKPYLYFTSTMKNKNILKVIKSP